MKIPEKPPPFEKLMEMLSDPSKIGRVITLKDARSIKQYLHWDKLRRMPLPSDYTLDECWLALKLQRMSLLQSISLKDVQGKTFQFCVPERVQEELHEIDVGAGGTIGVPEQITNSQTRDRYLIRSLMEEAITSSQLEGAVTTREVAKEMIRTGRTPRDTSEQMILNNFVTMQRISALKKDPLSPEMVFEIHRLVTEKTLEDPTAAGRFRKADEKRIVGDDYGMVFHDPPPVAELEERLKAMCDFANAKTPDYFIHPVVRAVIVHFWLAYDHPFFDGNGRTARALFYWAMLHHGYWLFEFISISSILRKAPVQYARSFLYTETDDNDLTYFIVAQANVIRQAIEGLHTYIQRKTSEVRELESHLRALDWFNHRQVDLIRHALKHPDQQYTITSHRKSHNVVYQTARTDLLDLEQRDVLEQKRKGRQMVFVVPRDLAERLRKMGKKINP